MATKLKRRNLKLTKRKHHKIKTKRRLTKRRQMKRKRTYRFRKSKKQYGGKFNDNEIEQIKDALRMPDAGGVAKNFTEDEINNLVERFNMLAQPLSEQGGFPPFLNFLEENDKATIITWIRGREQEMRDEEPQTDNDDSDIDF